MYLTYTYIGMHIHIKVKINVFKMKEEAREKDLYLRALPEFLISVLRTHIGTSQPTLTPGSQ